jgi:hypothetical protein
MARTVTEDQRRVIERAAEEAYQRRNSKPGTVGAALNEWRLKGIS